jgi:hypothetical protein
MHPHEMRCRYEAVAAELCMRMAGEAIFWLCFVPAMHTSLYFTSFVVSSAQPPPTAPSGTKAGTIAFMQRHGSEPHNLISLYQ